MSAMRSWRLRGHWKAAADSFKLASEFRGRGLKRWIWAGIKAAAGYKETPAAGVQSGGKLHPFLASLAKLWKVLWSICLHGLWPQSIFGHRTSVRHFDVCWFLHLLSGSFKEASFKWQFNCFHRTQVSWLSPPSSAEITSTECLDLTVLSLDLQPSSDISVYNDFSTNHSKIQTIKGVKHEFPVSSHHNNKSLWTD